MRRKTLESIHWRDFNALVTKSLFKYDGLHRKGSINWKGRILFFREVGEWQMKQTYIELYSDQAMNNAVERIKIV